jgi:hypothetical protein
MSASFEHASRHEAARLNYRNFGSERHVVLTVALLLLGTLLLLLVFPLRISTDSALYLEAAEKILEGKLPYVDYYEINLPTVHYLSVLPVAAAHALGVNSIPSFNVFIWLLLTYNVVCFWALVMRGGKASRSNGLSFLLLTVLTLIATWHTIAGNIYGQREHLFFLGFLPYVVLRWARLEGREPPQYLVFVIGLIAAVVTSIKPHFVLIPVLIEAYVLMNSRSLRLLKQPEIFGVLVAALIFALYFIVNPHVLDGYLNFILPALLEGYDAYGAITMMGVVVLNLIIVVYVAIALLPWLPGLHNALRLWSLTRPLSLMVIGGVIIFVVQRRGWEYHRIIADSAFIILAGIVVVSMLQPTRWLHGRRIDRERTPEIILLMIVLIVFANTARQVVAAPSLPAQEALSDALERHSEPDDYAMSFDWHGPPHYPALQVAELRQASRYLPSFPLCMVLVFVGSEVALDPTYTPTPLLRKFLDDSLEDIRQHQPSVIFMRREAEFGGCGSLNTHEFLRAQGVLVQLEQAGYRLVEEVSFFIIYARNAP